MKVTVIIFICHNSHLISILESVNLGDEVASEEVNVFTGEAVEVAVVVSTSRLAGLVKNIICKLRYLGINNGQSMQKY